MEIHVRGSMSRKMELLVREESEKTFLRVTSVRFGFFLKFSGRNSIMEEMSTWKPEYIDK